MTPSTAAQLIIEWSARIHGDGDRHEWALTCAELLDRNGPDAQLPPFPARSRSTQATREETVRRLYRRGLNRKGATIVVNIARDQQGETSMTTDPRLAASVAQEALRVTLIEYRRWLEDHPHPADKSWVALAEWDEARADHHAAIAEAADAVLWDCRTHGPASCSRAMCLDATIAPDRQRPDIRGLRGDR